MKARALSANQIIRKERNRHMATDILCKAVKYKNPKTGQFAERAVISTKECGSNDLYDFAAANGYLPSGSKKEVVVPAFAGLMAAAKALIETTGNSRVVLSDWLAVSPTLRNAALEAGRIPATARLVTALRVHSELRLDPAKFNLVLEGYDGSLVPTIGSMISDATGAERGRLVKDAPIIVSGRNFGETVEDASVRFVWNDGTETAGTVVTCADTLVKVAAVPEFAQLESGTEIKVAVTRTVDGASYTSAEKNVTIA